MKYTPKASMDIHANVVASKGYSYNKSGTEIIYFFSFIILVYFCKVALLLWLVPFAYRMPYQTAHSATVAVGTAQRWVSWLSTHNTSFRELRSHFHVQMPLIFFLGSRLIPIWKVMEESVVDCWFHGKLIKIKWLVGLVDRRYIAYVSCLSNFVNFKSCQGNGFCFTFRNMP